MPLSIISVQNLHKSFGPVHAVDGVSFQVKEGDLFAFLGPNGAGKSTTINILSTLLPYTEGDVRIVDFKLGKDDEKIRQQIGIVFQNSILEPLLTVKEILEIRGSIYGLYGREVKLRIDQLAEQIDLKDFINRAYGKLSGGQKRRVDIARALIHTPRILYLDEPTSGLDPQTRSKVWDIIHNLQNETKTTVFFSTHYMEEAAVADNVAIIDNGHIIAQGTAEELRMNFSSDVLRIIPKNVKLLEKTLIKMNLDYKILSGVIIISVENSIKALNILKEIENEILSFEVLRGSMEEVFLNLTGKELREGGDLS